MLAMRVMAMRVMRAMRAEMGRGEGEGEGGAGWVLRQRGQMDELMAVGIGSARSEGRC